MAYIRLTVATVPPAQVAEVRRCYEQLLAYVATLPGFVAGWVIAGPHPGEIGRLSVWESPAAANRAATDAKAFALHARIHVAAGGRLWDRSFAGDGPLPVETTQPGLDAAAVVWAAEAVLRSGQPGP